MKIRHRKLDRLREEKGLSMLEYAAGAAVLIGVVYIAMSTFGGGLGQFFEALGGWASDRATEVTASSGGSGSSGTPLNP